MSTTQDDKNDHKLWTIYFSQGKDKDTHVIKISIEKLKEFKKVKDLVEDLLKTFDCFENTNSLKYGVYNKNCTQYYSLEDVLLDNRGSFCLVPKKEKNCILPLKPSS